MKLEHVSEENKKKKRNGTLLLQVNLYVGNTQSPWQTFIFSVE